MKKYTLNELYAKGQISYTVLAYAEIKDKVNQLVKTGMSHGQAVNAVGRMRGITRQSVYHALRNAL